MEENLQNVQKSKIVGDNIDDDNDSDDENIVGEKDILISDPISGGTDPDHCICLPSLTAIIILFHNTALSYSEIIINHTLIIKTGLINE